MGVAERCVHVRMAVRLVGRGSRLVGMLVVRVMDVGVCMLERLMLMLVLVVVAQTFGWRMQSEVLSLERRQVDLEAGTLRLDPGTTKMARDALSISRLS